MPGAICRWEFHGTNSHQPKEVHGLDDSIDSFLCQRDSWRDLLWVPPIDARIASKFPNLRKQYYFLQFNDLLQRWQVDIDIKDKRLEPLQSATIDGLRFYKILKPSPNRIWKTQTQQVVCEMSSMGFNMSNPMDMVIQAPEPAEPAQAAQAAEAAQRALHQ